LEAFPWPWREVEVLLLILVRVGMVLFLFPFFSSRLIPLPCKAGLCVLLTVLFFPVVDLGSARLPASGPGVFQLLIAEFVVGMILGLMVQVFFEAVRMMGQMVGFQTGFAITNILDPQSGIQVSILSNMAYLVALMLFLSLDGHHLFLRALRDSYDILPVGALALKDEPLAELVGKLGDMFVLAIKMGAPAIVGLLFMKAAMGLVTKAIPQMNVMIVAFPLQIVVGLFLFGISLRVVLMLTDQYLATLSPLLLNTLAWMKG
jgi:flagellar biosynthesis protein FliR